MPVPVWQPVGAGQVPAPNSHRPVVGLQTPPVWQPVGVQVTVPNEHWPVAGSQVPPVWQLPGVQTTPWHGHGMGEQTLPQQYCASAQQCASSARAC